MKKEDKIIEELEFDFLSHVRDSDRLIPISNEDDIKALIWNLLLSKRWKKQISYKDYSRILSVLFQRLKK